MKKKIFSILLALLMAFTLIACKNEDEVVEKFKVTFDYNYTGGPTATVVEYDKGSKVDEPTAPKREGYTFEHWLLGNDPYPFTKEESEDFTLKAKWLKEEVETKVTITGVVRVVEVEIGNEYDPLEGVTAVDQEGNDLTGKLDSTFKPSWLQEVGDHRFEVFVEIDGVRTSVRVVLQVIGSESQVIVLEVPELMTHYIGTTFDLSTEVKAYDKNDSSIEYEIKVGEDWDDFFIQVPGTNNFTVVATDDDGRTLEKTIKLTTKAEVVIPNQIPKNEQITIEMWHSNGSAIETALKRYATEFEALMKKDGYNVKVNVEKPASTYDELRTTVVNALKGAKLPHLVQNYPDHVVEYNSFGVISSLLPYINHPVWGMGVNGNENESFGDILEVYRREQRAVTLDGDYLSLPFNKSTEVVTYNKDMFDEVLKGNPFPKTWQELFSYSEDFMNIKDEHINDIAAKWAASGDAMDTAEINKIKNEFVPYAYDSKGNAFITLTRQFGGQYTGRDAQGKGELLFDSESVRRMLTYFGENNDVINIPEVWDTNYASDMFKKGYTAMAIGSTGGIRYNTPVNKGTKLFNVGVAPMFYDENNPGRKSVIQQGTNISLTNEGTDAEGIVAWLFLKYLTSNEVQEDFSIVTGYSPVRNSVYSNPGFLEYLANANVDIKANHTQQGMTAGAYNTLYETKLKAMALQGVAADRQYLFFDTPYIGSSAARNAVGVAFERIMLRDSGVTLEKSIEDAISYAWDEASKVLDR